MFIYLHLNFSGYKAPESAEWNKFKDDEKRKRKRKLQGTYSDLTAAAPAFSDGLNEINEITNASKDICTEEFVSAATSSKLDDALVSELDNEDDNPDNIQPIMENNLLDINTQTQACKELPSTTLDTLSPSLSSASSTSSGVTSRRKPPPKHRLSCVIPSSDAGSGLNIYVRPPRQKKIDPVPDVVINYKDQHPTNATNIDCHDNVDNGKKWPSESSGIYTASSHCITPSGSTSNAEVDLFSPMSSIRADKDSISCRNEVIQHQMAKHSQDEAQIEASTTSVTSCSSLTTSSGSTQSCTSSMCSTSRTREGVCYSSCDVDCSRNCCFVSEVSSRTSLDPSLSSLNSSVSNTCSSSVISPTTSQSCCSSVSKSKQSSDSSAAVDLSQEWRRGRTSRKDISGKKCPRPVSTCAPKLEERKSKFLMPEMPTEKADIWSFGCLLVEALTGRKMFSASDKMASVLKPLQLLEMRIGETECRYQAIESEGDGKVDKHKFFADAKNLIQR